jgi:MYXO-CTERM domain-containing protein
LKRLFLLALLIVLVAPFGLKAEDHDWDDTHKHHHIRATEMAGLGIGAAALVGVAGYFLLRRRQDS